MAGNGHDLPILCHFFADFSVGGFRNLKGRGQSSDGGVFVKKIVITSGGASLTKDYDLHGYRRGGIFDSPKVPKSDLGLRPKDPVALLRWIRIYFQAAA